MGAYSLTRVDATGSSAPRPMPTMNRSTINMPTDVTSAEAPVATDDGVAEPLNRCAEIRVVPL